MAEEKKVRRKGWYEQDGILLRYLKEHAVNGELIASQREIAEGTGITLGSIARIIDRLEKEGRIRTQILRDENGLAKTKFHIVEIDESFDMTKVFEVAEELISKLEETKDYIDWLRDRIAALERQFAELRRGKRLIEGRVISSVKLPGGLRNIIVQLPAKARAEEKEGLDVDGEEEAELGTEEPEVDLSYDGNEE